MLHSATRQTGVEIGAESDVGEARRSGTDRKRKTGATSGSCDGGRPHERDQRTAGCGDPSPGRTPTARTLQHS